MSIEYNILSVWGQQNNNVYDGNSGQKMAPQRKKKCHAIKNGAFYGVVPSALGPGSVLMPKFLSQSWKIVVCQTFVSKKIEKIPTNFLNPLFFIIRDRSKFADCAFAVANPWKKKQKKNIYQKLVKKFYLCSKWVLKTPIWSILWCNHPIILYFCERKVP